MVIDMSQLLSDLRCLKHKEFREKYLGVLPPHFLISNALSNLKEHGGFEQAIDKSFEVRAFPALEGIYLFQQGDEYEVCSLERGTFPWLRGDSVAIFSNASGTISPNTEAR